VAWPSEEVKIIKNPTPNCVESNYNELIKFKELKESEQSNEFLISPFSLIVDDNGNIFVYDNILVKIFKYDSNLKLIKTFGAKGKGPGEIGGSGGRYILGSLFIKNNCIYFGDWSNNKIICFNTNGDLIREILFKKRLSYEMIPVVDNLGNIFLHADRNENNKYIIDCFDDDGNYLRGFLDRDNLFVGLFIKSVPELQNIPGVVIPDWYSESTTSNIQYSINNKNQLLIYSSTSGCYWLFNKGNLQKTGKLWPKNALLDYKISLKEVSREGGFYSFFQKIILDQDDQEKYLLHYGYYQNGNKDYYYQFDLNGKLGKVYYILNNKKTFNSVEYKKNNSFYGITKNSDDNFTISIFKEVAND
jgi:hypothetical protein